MIHDTNNNTQETVGDQLIASERNIESSVEGASVEEVKSNQLLAKLQFSNNTKTTKLDESIVEPEDRVRIYSKYEDADIFRARSIPINTKKAKERKLSQPEPAKMVS